MRHLILILLAALSAAPVFAADGAQVRAIGFSKDNRYFAFEQYGTQDGSGFAYSDVFVLDISKDAWVPGTPARVLVESEDNALGDARAKALAQAAPALDATKPYEAVDTLVHMPFTEIAGERRKVRFARYYNSMGTVEGYEHLGSYVLEVKNIAVPQVLTCPDLDFITIMGLELTLTNVKSGVAKTLAKDQAIPKSRYCPHGYDLEAIFAPAGYSLGKDPLVAIIGVYSRGFEGSDRRFIAVPFELHE